jgi:alpha-glucosidase (family GH31 glycosyl hydrolase)
VSANSNGFVLRRDATVWIMGKVSNPPPGPDESVEHYFKTAGREIHYEIRLRFIPLLPQAEYEKLKMARQQALAQLRKGSSGKAEYDQRQTQYEECQVPALFTQDYSIFVDRWADGGASFGYRIEPLFIDVYPPAAASEIEALIKNLSKVFKRYENLGD